MLINHRLYNPSSLQDFGPDVLQPVSRGQSSWGDKTLSLTVHLGNNRGPLNVITEAVCVVLTLYTLPCCIIFSRGCIPTANICGCTAVLRGMACYIHRWHVHTLWTRGCFSISDVCFFMRRSEFVLQKSKYRVQGHFTIWSPKQIQTVNC